MVASSSGTLCRENSWQQLCVYTYSQPKLLVPIFSAGSGGAHLESQHLRDWGRKTGNSRRAWATWEVRDQSKLCSKTLFFLKKGISGILSLKIFYYVYLFCVCIYVCMCHGIHVKVRGQLESFGLSSTMWSQGLNAGFQVWHQKPLSTEPLHQPLNSKICSLKKFLIFWVGAFCFVCRHVHYPMCSTLRGHEKALDPLVLELRPVVSRRVCWESNPDALEEQLVLLGTEPSL